MSSPGPILLVEDDPNDLELTLTALNDYQLADEVVVAGDGSEALDYLYRRGAFASRVNGSPAVMLLDLKLPKVGGLEVLQQVKGDGGAIQLYKRASAACAEIVHRSGN